MPAYPVNPVYLIICPCSVVMITLGQVIAYGIGAGFEHVHSGWRYMVGLGAVPAGLQLLLLGFLPESRKSTQYQ